jgi:hypothetical protein
MKETPSLLLCGKSPRQVMQLLGTEFGRNLVGEEFWSRIWLHTTEGRHVVADDCRFPNEVRAIQRRDGVTLRVMRPGHVATEHSSHASETALDGFVADFVVLNDSTRSDLIDRVEAVIQEYSRARAAEKTFPVAYSPSAAE